MSRHQYRLHEYFDQLDKREEISEAELRTLVDRVEEKALTSTSLHHGGFLMKTALVLCALLFGSATFWYTQYEYDQNKQPWLFNPIALNSTEGMITHKNSNLLERPQASNTSFADDSTLATSFFSTNQGFRSYVRTEPSVPLKLKKIPWGYRLQPGQKLWYEHRTTQIDPSSGDTSILVKQAMIEVENVDHSGNITLLLSTERSAKKQEPNQVKTAFENSVSTNASVQYRATITALGEFIDGSIIDDPQEKEWLETINAPNFEGALRGIPSTTVKSQISQWLPRWPAKENFNKQYHAYEGKDWIDTSYALTNDITEDPSRHLDTLGNYILYVSARARGIEQDSSIHLEQELDNASPKITDVIVEEGRKTIYITEVDSQNLPTEKTSTYTYQEDPNTDRSEIKPQLSRNRLTYRYKLDSSSLAPTSEVLNLINATEIAQRIEKENRIYTDKQTDKGSLVFRKSDGAVVTQTVEGTSFYSEESFGASFMNRQERTVISSSSLHLIQSEMSGVKAPSGIPSID